MIRLGVIGTGRIAARFMYDMELVPQTQAVCVYNPHSSSAGAFAEKHRVGMATDDWDKLMACVDAVYIASPHHTHVDYAKRALECGKHVLCEKPMAFSKAQAEGLFALAKENRLVLMEAVKTAYCPGFQHLLKTAQSGVIGEVRDVEACFTKLEDPAGRELTDPVYGGSLIELGTYVLLPVIKIFGDDPTDIQFRSIKDGKGTDLFTKVELCYGQGFGLGKVGLGVKSEGNLVISGTKGYIYAKAPWWLTKEYEVRFEDPGKRMVNTFGYERNGLLYELRAFAEEIQAAGKERGRVGHNARKSMSSAFAAVMERFLEYRSL